MGEKREIAPPGTNPAFEFSDPGPVGIREKVVLDFRLSNSGKASGHDGDLSISVSPAGIDPAPDISEYLVYASESGRMGRDNALTDNYPDLIYEAEKEHHFIRGQLLDRRGQGLAAGRYMFLSIPGKNAVFQYSLTDDEGRFVFSLPIIEGISDLIIQPENPGPDDVIRIEPSFSGILPSSGPAPASTASSGSHIVKWGINYQPTRIFGADSAMQPPVPTVPAREV